MNTIRILSACAAALALSAGAQAATYTEDFEADFPAWESGWFGTQSNARNYYCFGALNCATRGNNPDGLWISNDAGGSSSPVSITFAAGFAAGMTSLHLDVAGYAPTTLSAWDKDGNTIFSQAVSLTSGAYSDPGSYAGYTITSANGIGGFAFSGAASGNTSIDNLNVLTSAVPEPQTALLMLAGMLAVGAVKRRR
jgi:hypothetical protein